MMKKVIGILLTVVLILGVLPMGVWAGEETVISIVNGGGYDESVNHSALVLRPEIRIESGPKPAGYTYAWFVNQGDGFVKRPWETSPEFIISTTESIASIAVEVTPVDANGISVGPTIRDDFYIHTWYLGKMGGYGDDEGFTAEIGSCIQKTPEEYKFEVNGTTFIMLDVMGNGTYYIMAEDAVEQMPFDEDGTVIYDPEDPNNIGYWLKNEYYANMLPEELKTYTDKEHTWTTERPYDAAAGADGAAQWSQYDKISPVAIMSGSEFIKYLGRFGLWLNQYLDKEEILENGGSYPGDTGWWLRTADQEPSPSCNLASLQEGWNGGADKIAGRVGKEEASERMMWVRPTMYIYDTFFREVRLDLSKMGEKVKQELYRRFGADGLLNIYTQEELIQAGICVRPEANNVKMQGVFKSGAHIMGGYTYEHSENITEAKSIMGFEIADSPEGSYTEVAAGNTYVIEPKIQGKYIRFFVIPRDERGALGERVTSKAVRASGLTTISVENIIFDDGVGGRIDPQQTGTVRASVTIRAKEPSAGETICMLAVYDAEGRMLINRACRVLMKQDRAENVQLTLENPGVGEGGCVEFVVWDSLQSMNSEFIIGAY